jgi:hypothetical protein
MEALQQEIAQRFYDNIAYFEHAQPAVYEKLAAFDSALNNGYYQQRYDLIFDEGYLDVIELATGNKLYGSDSGEHADLAAQAITYDRHYNCFASFTQEQHSPLIDYIRSVADDKDTMRAIEKFIFFGVGLGLHLEQIHAKIAAKCYLIIEDDLELFRLSLFAINYTQLAQSAKLYFAIFEQRETFTKILDTFLLDMFYYNHHIKYFHLLSHKHDKMAVTQHAMVSSSHLNFYYPDLLQEQLQPLALIKGGYRFIDMQTLHNENPLQGREVLLLAAGPSLGREIKWVKQQQGKITIVAVSATLPILHEHGIKPDIVIHIDGKSLSMRHFHGVEESIDDALLILAPNLSLADIAPFDKTRTYMMESGTAYKKGAVNLHGYCVGSTAYAMLLYLGVRTLYLLGLDLALDQDSLSTHAAGHRLKRSVESDERHISYRTTQLKVRGNFQKEVITLPYLNVSIDMIAAFTPRLKQEGTAVYNLGDGAYLEDTVPQKTAQTILRKDKVSTSSVHASFRDHAGASLSLNEKDALKVHILNIYTVKNALVEHRSKSFSKTHPYQLALIELLTKLLSYENSDALKHILLSCLQYNLSFLFDLCNRQLGPSEEQHIETMDALLYKDLMHIVESYEKELQQFL